MARDSPCSARQHGDARYEQTCTTRGMSHSERAGGLGLISPRNSGCRRTRNETDRLMRYDSSGKGAFSPRSPLLAQMPDARQTLQSKQRYSVFSLWETRTRWNGCIPSNHRLSQFIRVLTSLRSVFARRLGISFAPDVDTGTFRGECIRRIFTVDSN